jgi:hypothetical protein
MARSIDRSTVTVPIRTDTPSRDTTGSATEPVYEGPPRKDVVGRTSPGRRYRGATPFGDAPDRLAAPEENRLVQTP